MLIAATRKLQGAIAYYLFLMPGYVGFRAEEVSAVANYPHDCIVL